MSDPKGASKDPSMDDILASIRKIISDDEARAQVNRGQSGRPSDTAPVGLQQSAAARDDVLLLTDLIEEPKSEEAGAAVTPKPLPRRAAEMSEPSAQPSTDNPLVAAAVAGAASSAFARLNQAVQESVPDPAAPDPGPAVATNGKTIEELVKEMLRPMLKEWLDRNLPAIVERYVEREVVRLTRR
jgi:cell pole-organizing protein PopZ